MKTLDTSRFASPLGPILLWADGDALVGLEFDDRRARSSRWEPEEILNQIRIARKQSTSSGHIHWNMKSLMRNGALDAALEREVYGQPSLIPASPWLDKARLPKPTISVVTGERAAQLKISWTSGEAGAARLWLLQTRTGSEWTTEILPATKTSRMWNSSPPEVIAISAVDFNGNLSPTASMAQTRK